MYYNVFKMYKEQLCIDMVAEDKSLKDSHILDCLNRGLTLYNGEEEKLNWKLVCHFVQALSAYFAEVMTRLKQGQHFHNNDATSLLTCSCHAFRISILKCVENKLSEQQMIGIYAPLWANTLAFAYSIECTEDTTEWQSEYINNILQTILNNVKIYSKVLLIALTVTKPPNQSRPISCIRIRINILVQCLLSTYLAEQSTDTTIIVTAEKALQRRSDVINLIVAVIATTTPLSEANQLGDVLAPLVKHEDLRQQLKIAYHSHITRRSDLCETTLPAVLIDSMYHTQEEEEAQRISLQTNALLLNNATTEAVLTGQVVVVADIKRLLGLIDPAEATVAFNGAKLGKVKKEKKNTEVCIHALLLQVNAMQLWTALTQWAMRYDARRETDRESGTQLSELAVAEDIPQTAGRYLDAAMRHLKGIGVMVEAVRGSKSQAEYWCVCGALLQCARALMTSLYLTGRCRDQECVLGMIATVHSLSALPPAQLTDLLYDLRCFTTLTSVASGITHKTIKDISSALSKLALSKASSYYASVDEFSLVSLALLHSNHCTEQQSFLTEYTSANNFDGAIALPSNSTEFIALAKTAYRACMVQQKRSHLGGGLQLLPWVCAMASKVLMLVYRDLATSLTWASYTSSSLSKVENIQLRSEAVSALLEALLVRADLYEHCGNLDGCLVYLREAAAVARALHSSAMSSCVSLHTVRVWMRTDSPKLQCTVEDILSAGDEQIYSSTAQLSDEITKSVRTAIKTLDILFNFRPEEDNTDCSSFNGTTNMDTSSLCFRHMVRYWDIEAGKSGDLKNTYNTFLTADERRSVRTALIAGDVPTAAVFSGLSIASMIDSSCMEILEVVPSGAFDVIRDLRRHLSLQSIQQSASDRDTFISFLAGISSCGVASECIGEATEVPVSNKGAEDVEEAEGSPTNSSSATASVESLGAASVCIRQALRGCPQSSKLIQQKLNNVISHCQSLDRDASASAVCFLAIDRPTSTLLLGRMDHDVVLVTGLPLEGRLCNLLQRWDDLQERNKAMLRQGFDVELIGKLSEEQKRAWWSSRQKYDSDIEAALSDFQELLGPWRALLSTSPHKVELSMLKQELIAVLFNSKPTKTQTAQIEKLLPWLQLIGSNLQTAVGSSLTPLRTMPLSLAEATTAISLLLSQLSIKTTAGNCNLVEEVLNSIVRTSTTNTTFMKDSTEANSSSSVDKQQQRQIELNSLKVTELRALLKDAGQDAVGKKQDLIDRLLVYESSSNTATSSAGSPTELNVSPSGHVVLVLDEKLQRLPLECMPALRTTSCSRVPSCAILLRLIDNAVRDKEKEEEQGTLNQLTTHISNMDLSEKNTSAGGRSRKTATKTTKKSDADVEITGKNNTPNTMDGSLWKGVSVEKCWYALDIEGNLPLTRDTLQPFLSEYSDRWNWTGVVAKIPTEETTRELHESSELFIYCGHGAGERMYDTFRLRKFSSCPASLLWGCSSGALKTRGVHDALGTAVYYLMAGAPFLVANLWDVTDKDIDKLSMAHMQRIFNLLEIENIKETNTTGSNTNAASALACSRDVCRMPYAVGAAPVVYGIPALLSVHS